jgi:hypothetical protein
VLPARPGTADQLCLTAEGAGWRLGGPEQAVRAPPLPERRRPAGALRSAGERLTAGASDSGRGGAGVLQLAASMNVHHAYVTQGAGGATVVGYLSSSRSRKVGDPNYQIGSRDLHYAQFMAVDRGVMIAWSAGVSAAAAGIAALFADGRTPFDRATFTGFLVISAVTFLLLVGAAIPVSWLHFSSHRGEDTKSGDDSASSPASGEAGALTQINVARDGGSVFAAQGGNVIVHPRSPGQGLSAPPGPGDADPENTP